MQLGKLVGQTLDGKYRIERELGKGGMGAVFLSTHVGTERAVAVKVIVPEFMERAEFVERFRREARAAGRLRHPNVVDVTDFGIADTDSGRVAYLVMEYLDGCTLGEILAEEEKLPVKWTIDILEQICGAVQEAHTQGIIHRDLKPDNIWLEPNQRGGYTVKVLDFGIAKLEEHLPADQTEKNDGEPEIFKPARATAAGLSRSDTFAADRRVSTEVAEAATIAQGEESNTLIQNIAPEAVFFENGTAILPPEETADQENTGTKILTESSSVDNSADSFNDKNDDSLAHSVSKELTRFGAVLGTPLYMSPEQCGGEHLDARSDIYSLGVIAYQMLSGKTPFDGDFKDVLKAHQETAPPPLEAKKVPRKLKREIHNALAKKADERPPTAQSFAGKLRSTSENLGTLIQKALVIYGEHLPKFLLISLFAAIPLVLLSLFNAFISLLSLSENYNGAVIKAIGILNGFGSFFLTAVYAAMMVGMTTWIVAQILAAPVKSVSVRASFAEVRKKWRSLSGTVLFSTMITIAVLFLFIIIGAIAGTIVWLLLKDWLTIKLILIFIIAVASLIPGIYVTTIFSMVTPVVMMEDLRGRAAFRRSRLLTNRSFTTVFTAIALNFLIPMSLAFALQAAVGGIVTDVSTKEGKPPDSAVEKVAEPTLPGGLGAEGTTNKPNIETGEKQVDDKNDMQQKVRHTVTGAAFEILWLPISILIVSFTSIVTALIYFKTRQAGGETMQELLRDLETADQPRRGWQRRIQKRLLHSSRLSHKT